MERVSIDALDSLDSVKKENSLANNKGQAAVEYVLLLVVMTSIIVSILSYLKRNHLGTFEDCIKGKGQKGFVCNIYASLGLDFNEDGKKFKYFKFKR